MTNKQTEAITCTCYWCKREYLENSLFYQQNKDKPWKFFCSTSCESNNKDYWHYDALDWGSEGVIT